MAMVNGIWSLATKPFLVLNLASLFAIRTGFIVLITWTELVRATVSLHLSLLWRMLLFALAILALPLRLLSAISRERQLETQVQCMRSEVESLLWDQKTLEQRLRSAFREHKTMERMLLEVEAENDMAVAQIELLRDQLEGLMKENRHLKEVRGKDHWGVTNKAGHDDATVTESAGRDRVVIRDSTKHANEQPVRLSEAINQRRRTAIGNSMFSAVLALSVGAVVLEAEAPCMPLVAALFVVVGMSSKSVFEFFSVVNSGPALEASVLLGLNCFILGALTCPALPGAVRLVGLSFS